ncbi:MAG: hypothetical protein C0467_23710 [Planctomycetaceae bacterium]|nr:hypothetical protein [Planctomycetaceae bacterium]
MADDDTDTAERDATPPPTVSRFACLWFFVGFFVAGLVGMGLAFWAMLAQAPGWLIPLACIGPEVAFLLIFGSTTLPRIIRYARESVRNAPSPESAAAAAAGEGVEAGTKAKRVKTEDRDGFPTVEVVETEPGKTLTHSLHRAGVSAGCQFGCAVFFASFWNGIVGVFVVQAFTKWNAKGVVAWVEALFLSPFVLVGLVLIAFTLYAGLTWIVSWLVGRVEVEISEHPLAVGGSSRIQITQAGLFPLARVCVWLVCTEEATYVAGTSQSTAKKEIAKHSVSDPDESPTGGGLPLATEFKVPADAMHSFDAPNNEIKWTLRVTGRVLGVLPYRNDYAVTVCPA